MKGRKDEWIVKKERGREKKTRRGTFKEKTEEGKKKEREVKNVG